MTLADLDALAVHPVTLIMFTATVSIGGAAIVQSLRERSRAMDVLDDLRTWVLPHFRPPVPGQPDVSLPARIPRVEHEIHPNDGHSMRDQINRVEEHTVPAEDRP